MISTAPSVARSVNEVDDNTEGPPSDSVATTATTTAASDVSATSAANVDASAPIQGQVNETETATETASISDRRPPAPPSYDAAIKSKGSSNNNNNNNNNSTVTVVVGDSSPQLGTVNSAFIPTQVGGYSHTNPLANWLYYTLLHTIQSIPYYTTPYHILRILSR